MTLKIMCARSMTTAVNALAGKFTRASGKELDITFGTVGALQTKLAAGESADILILGAPAIAKMEQEGAIASEWGASENNRKAKFYKLTRAGRKRLEQEAREWEQATAIVARFFTPGEEPA